MVCAAVAALAFLAEGPKAIAASGVDPFTTLTDQRQKAAEDPGVASVHRFTAAPDDRVFQLEVSRRAARVRFLCTPADPRIVCALDGDRHGEEAIALEREPGARGDVLYRDCKGKLVVRVTPYGNATVYWPGESAGRAATKRGEETGRLRLTPFTREEAEARAAAAAGILAERFGLAARFELGPTDEDLASPAPGLADAVLRAASGLEAAASSEPAFARRLANGLQRIVFVESDTSSVRLDGEALLVSYHPGAGVAASAGSAEIAAMLTAGF